jgi:hypothetical protein
VHKNFSLSFVSSNSSDPTDRKFVVSVDKIVTLKWLRRLHPNVSIEKEAKPCQKMWNWMGLSRVISGSDCKCKRFTSPEFNSSIVRNSELWVAADEVVLKVVNKKYRPKWQKKDIKMLKSNYQDKVKLFMEKNIFFRLKEATDQ